MRLRNIGYSNPRLVMMLGLFLSLALCWPETSFAQRGRGGGRIGGGGIGGGMGGGARPQVQRPNININRPSVNMPGPREMPNINRGAAPGSRARGIDRPANFSRDEVQNRLNDLHSKGAGKYWGEGQPFAGGGAGRKPADIAGPGDRNAGENLRDRFQGQDILPKPGESRPGDRNAGQQSDLSKAVDRVRENGSIPGQRRPGDANAGRQSDLSRAVDRAREGGLAPGQRRPGDLRPGQQHNPDWIAPHHVDNTIINNINNNFHGYGDYWTHGWYAGHPWAWCPAVPIAPAVWWAPVVWNDVWAFGAGALWGSATTVAEPVYYNYGDNITYNDDGMVYVNNVPYVSADEYYQQGVAIADEGADTPADSETATTAEAPQKEAGKDDTANQWKPLGTFAVLSDPKQTSSHIVLQLAMNKDGVIRGNIYNQVSDKVQQIEGAVDSKTQRVAFRITGDKDNLAECGLWNLTQDTLSVLIHKGKDESLTRTLIRLTDPDKESAADSEKAPQKS